MQIWFNTSEMDLKIRHYRPYFFFNSPFIYLLKNFSTKGQSSVDPHYSWILHFESAYLLTLFVSPKLILPQLFADMCSGKKLEFPAESEQAIFCLLVSGLILETSVLFAVYLVPYIFFCIFALFIDDFSVYTAPSIVQTFCLMFPNTRGLWCALYQKYMC